MWEHASSFATMFALVAVGSGVAFFSGFTATIPVLVTFIASTMSTSIAAVLAWARSRAIAKQHAQLAREIAFDHRQFSATISPSDEEVVARGMDQLQGEFKC